VALIFRGGQILSPVVGFPVWKQLKIGAGGFLIGSSIAADNTYVVRTDTYGAYIWNPNATTPQGNAGGSGAWQQLVTSASMTASFVAQSQTLAGVGVWEIEIARSNSSVMYMVFPVYPGSGVSGVYKTTNKGGTWTQTGFTALTTSTNFPPNSSFRFWGQKMAIHPTDPNTVYVGSAASGMFKTADGGTSWSAVTGVPTSSADPGITGILFNPGNTSVIYAASSGNGIYQTTNGGVGSWTSIGGGGPTQVRLSAISSHDAGDTHGTYFVVDGQSTPALWRYAGGTWTNISTTIGASPDTFGAAGVAVDPNNSQHVVAVSGNGYVIESTDTGATWSSWSNTPAVASADIPWQVAALGQVLYTSGLFFDQSVSGKLYVNGDNDFFTMTLSGAITGSTVPSWSSQGVGIEQLVANQIIAPPSGGSTPIVASWDRAVFHPNLTAYPSTLYPVANANVVAGWSIDYASSNASFIAVMADGTYAGGPQRSSYSQDGGATWTAFPNQPYSIFGGNVAASTPDNLIFASAGGVQPYYTTNARAGTVTWNAISLPGSPAWTSFLAAYFGNRQLIAADRVAANTFYLVYDQNGVYKSTNSGATWTKVFNPSAVSGPFWFSNAGENIQAVPGQAGNLFYSPGSVSDPTLGNPFYQSTDAGVTWNSIAGVNNVYAFGFGAVAGGKSYPSIYIAGYLTNTSSTSVTVGTGSQTFTIVTGATIYPVGAVLNIWETGNNANTMSGTVTSYNSGSGQLVVNISDVTGSGTHSDWTIAEWGIWQSDDQAVTWKQLGPFAQNSLDTVKAVSGDPNIYGRVYIGFGGSGYMMCG
jgi:hypothetical protein